MPEYLRSVPPSSDDGKFESGGLDPGAKDDPGDSPGPEYGPGDPPRNGDGPKTDRSRPHPRAQRILPTDRMKFEIQVQALKAFAIASKHGQFAVTSEEIASYLPVAAQTAGLNNNWYRSMGLLHRESKGRYKPTEAVIQFARDHTWNPGQAGRALAPTLKETWCFEAVQNQLAMGTANREQLIRALGQVACATAAHTGHLESIVQWLEYAQLLGFNDSGQAHLIDLETDGPEADTSAPDAGPPAAEVAHRQAEGIRSGGDGGGQPPRIDPPRIEHPAGVLGLTFDLQLTAEDLAKLSAEQIEALFAAVGKIMAIKAAGG